MLQGCCNLQCLRNDVPSGFIEMNEPDNYKKGLERLRARYKDGLDFTQLCVDTCLCNAATTDIAAPTRCWAEEQ